MVATRPARRALQDNEVVVCGRRAGLSRYRAAVAETRPTPGHAASARAASRSPRWTPAATRCSAVGRDQQCGGGFDVIGIGFAIARGIAQALLNRD